MDARGVVAALKGKWNGRSGICLCPGHNDQRPSLQVSDDGQGGIRVFCHAGCSWRIVKDALKSMGLLDGEDGSDYEPAPPPDNSERIAKAQAIWKESKQVSGTVAEQYLRNRGISIPLPQTLRFHSALKYPNTNLFFPSLVAAVTREGCKKIQAVHRTFISLDGSNKARVSEPKMSLGVCRSGSIHLAPAAETMCVGEGLESTLSYMQATNLPGWTALNTSGLKTLILPSLPLASTIYIASDNDAPGQAAARHAAERWTREGRVVRIATPPKPETDFNDVLQRVAAMPIDERKVA